MEGGHSRNRGGVCPSGDGRDREGQGLLGTQEDRGLAPTETEQDKFCPRLFPGRPGVRTPALPQQEAGIRIRLGNRDPSLKRHSTALPPQKKKKKIPSLMLEGHKSNSNKV